MTPHESTVPAPLSDADLSSLLHAVGLDRTTPATAYGRRFAELGLDSLARLELATRVQDRYGVDVEHSLTADATPEALQAQVNARLGALGRGGSA